MRFQIVDPTGPGFKTIKINKYKANDTNEIKTQLELFTPNNSINLNAINKPPLSTLLNYGKLTLSTDNQIVLTINGQRKALSAINFLITQDVIKSSANQGLYQQLIQERQNLTEHITPRKPPIKSKPSSAFTMSGKIKTKTKSRHEVSKITRQVKGGEREYIFKEDLKKRAVTEIEAFNSFCYRLLLGDRTPKMRTLHDEINERAGLVITPIPGYESFREYFSKYKKNPVDLLLTSRVALVLAAGYCEEENDLHSGNFGLDNQLRAVKIDNDQATFSVTSKYINTEGKGKFPVTETDITNFPILQDAQPFNGPDRHGEEKIFHLRKLRQSEEFNSDTFYIFLKRILIEDSVYQAAAHATISSPKLQKELIENKTNKTKELSSVLLKMTAFQKYVISHPQEIKQIITELKLYNNDFKNDKYSFLRVNLEAIKNNYDKISEECRNQLAKQFPQQFKFIAQIGQLKDDLQGYIDSRETKGFKSFFRNTSLTDKKIAIANETITQLTKIENNIISNLPSSTEYRKDFAQLISTMEKKNANEEKIHNVTYKHKPTKSGLNEILADARTWVKEIPKEITDEPSDKVIFY